MTFLTGWWRVSILDLVAKTSSLLRAIASSTAGSWRVRPGGRREFGTRETLDPKAIGDELEELMPCARALLARAREALSALELELIGKDLTWSQERYDVFDLLTGRRRLYDLVADLHEATDDAAMETAELEAARMLGAWEARLSCHGNTEPCFSTGDCGKR